MTVLWLIGACDLMSCPIHVFRPPQLLTAISDTLQCIAERVAKRRRRSSASDRPTVSIALVEALGQSLHPDNADDCVAAIAALRDLVERCGNFVIIFDLRLYPPPHAH